jgi:cis-L-3-hydroxyproline dehydratase
MRLNRADKEMLDGHHGEAKRTAMDALVQLGEAFDAPDMVDIGYAHIHAGMGLYLKDVELMEELADLGGRMSVPASANIANADMADGNPAGAPGGLFAYQRRAEAAHRKLGSACSFTCTPYWAGFWPTWNMHMASIESTVTVFCNSVLGARSNRDGFFAVYAAVTGRYPRFGYHLDANRIGTHRVRVETQPEAVSDFSCLGFHIGRAVGEGVPVLAGLARRPSLDDLDALGAGMATSGGVALFIVPGVTPPFADESQAFPADRSVPEVVAGGRDIQSVYAEFSGGGSTDFDLVHLGCPHASFTEMRRYAELLDGRRVHGDVALWVTTSRAVREAARDAGYVAAIEKAGGTVISDTCPMSCHFARTTSPDPALGVTSPDLRGIVIDSAKQAKYLRDMVPGAILLTGPEEAVESALGGRFVARRRNWR